MRLLRVAGDIQLTPRTQAHLASEREAAERLGAEDGFFKAATPFDMALRMETEKPVTKEEFKEFLEEQAGAFDERQEQLLRGVLEGVAKRFAAAGFDVPLPAEVAFVKTSGKEEEHSAYTRGPAVFLPPNFLQMSPGALEPIIVHELFHVLSNCDGEVRKRLYATLGFTPCAPVELPESLKRRIYTNPDAYGNDYCIKVECKGQEVTVTPLLLSPFREYDAALGASRGMYIAFRLLALKEEGGRLVPWLVDGQMRLLALSACPSYQEKIGGNTDYIPQPEEVLAENFRMLVYGSEGLKNPEIPEKMREVFEKYAAERKGAGEAVGAGAKERAGAGGWGRRLRSDLRSRSCDDDMMMARRATNVDRRRHSPP